MKTVKDAVALRFVALMKDHDMKTNELAVRSGVTPSSVYSMLDPRRKEVSINLIKKLCDGLDITLGVFLAMHCSINWLKKFAEPLIPHHGI